MATADLRPLPDVMIIGTQRGGTTSLHTWLCAHPQVGPFGSDEVHYFDGSYFRGERWYRSHFPLKYPRRVSVVASPYMMFHPLAAERAGHDLPPSTRFLAVLREPAERAMSHYRLERSLGRESETFARALELEDSRLDGEREKLETGGRSRNYRWHSYRARGRYAEQLQRWYEVVGLDRVMVLESERLFEGSGLGGDLLRWLGLPPLDVPYPALNASPEPTPEDKAVLGDLRAYYEPYNEALFELLGRRLWTE